MTAQLYGSYVVLVLAAVAATRLHVGVGVLLGVVGVLAIGWFVTRRITTPVVEMTRVAQALCSGQYGVRVRRRGAGEIGVLGDTLNRLAQDLGHLEGIRRDFVANVSHEFKTPLTSIRGYVETLLSGAVYDKDNNIRFLQKIDAHVERLTRLVQDLLSLARIEAQQGALLVESVDWCDVVARVLARYETPMREKGLQCVIDTPQVMLVAGESEAMTRIVENLLSNAMQYTPSPGRITIRLVLEDPWGVLTVADTGIGIAPEDQERIFERFYRADRARSRAAGGTGLGLSIVKHLALAMHGEVGVRSEPGAGSTFVIRLPRS